MSYQQPHGEKLFDAGEPVAQIAADYELPADVIDIAIVYEEQPRLLAA